MKRIYRSCFIGIIMLTSSVTTISYAEELTSYLTPISTSSTIDILNEKSKYNQLKNLDSQGAHQEATAEAVLYLKDHPEDGDVRLLLGIFYFRNKNYADAQRELLTILQQTPSYTDASLVLINVQFALHNDKAALDIANVGLIFNPLSVELKKKKADILYITQSRPVEKKTTLAITHKFPTSSKKIIPPIAPKKEPIKYLNEMGTYQQQYYISDVKKIWDYSSLYYGRETALGKVYGKINYNNRLGRQALQGEIEAYPKLNKYVYLDLDFAYAHDPNLFPDQHYGAEAYVTAGKTVNFSLGGKYNKVDSHHQFSVYTGMLSKDHGSERLTFRPYYFVPGVGENSTLYTLDFRHTITDPYYYFGCIIGAGTSPDLANLTTVNFLVVRNKLISPYINFPMLNDRLIANLAFLYQNQLFPRDRVRDWTGATMGLVWKF